MGSKRKSRVLNAYCGQGLKWSTITYILLVKASHKVSLDLKGRKINSTYTWEEMQGCLAKAWLLVKVKDCQHFNNPPTTLRMTKKLATAHYHIPLSKQGCKDRMRGSEVTFYESTGIRLITRSRMSLIT